MQDELLSLQDAAKALGVKPITLRKWDREDKLKAVRVGSRGDRKYRQEDIDQLLAQKTPGRQPNWQEYIRNGATYRMISQIAKSMSAGLQERFGFSFTHFMAYFEDGNLFWYYDNNDLYNFGKAVVEKFTNSKTFCKQFFTQSYQRSEAIFALMREKDEEFLGGATREQLAEIYRQYSDLIYQDYSLSLSIDGIDETLMIDITRRIKEILKIKLGSGYSDKEHSRVYNVLVTPSHLSYVNDERKMLLTLAADIATGSVKKSSSEYQQRVQEIIGRFWWTNLGWGRDKPKDQAEIEKNLKELHTSAINVKSELAKIAKYSETVAKEKAAVEAKYKFSKDKELSKWLEIYDMFVDYHDYRKEVQMKSNVWAYSLIDAISEKTGIPMRLLDWAEPEEIVRVLLLKEIDEDELNQRSASFLYLNLDGVITKTSGAQAKKKHAEILSRQLEEIRDLQGSSASGGLAVGEAFVAISRDKALKIQPGQILVTGMTTPEYVPAMRKAAAIVTDEGGITCHAAIISRELGIPCIVGTRHATKIIKTGDIIEVRANHGVVRILVKKPDIKNQEKPLDWFLLQERGDNIPLTPGISAACKGYVNSSTELFGLPKIHLMLTWKEGGGRLYVEQSEWSRCSDLAFDQTLKDPSLMAKTLAKFREMLPKLEAVDAKIRVANLSKMKGSDIWDLYQEYVEEYAKAYSWSEPLPIWLSGQLTDYLEKYLKDLLIKNDQSKMFGEYFEALITTPEVPFTTKEEESFLEIAKTIAKNKKASQLFQGESVSRILEALPQLAKINAMIDKHTEDFAWVPYDYGSSIWDKEYFVKTLSETFAKKLDIEARLNTIKGFYGNITKKQKRLFAERGVDKHHQKLFQALQLAVYMIDFKKEVFTKSHFVAKRIMDEIKERCSLTKNQLWRLSQDDVRKALLGEPLNLKALDERWNFAVSYFYDANSTFEGASAKAFLEKLNMSDEAESESIETKGICACGGRAKGRAKIVKSSQEIGKVELGDVLITYMTTPDFVPAMRKAAAIVTNEGGITCHAAIVSRELNIPCIVGTKNAVSVFKDGDLVEVCANHGVARIIERSNDEN